MEQVIYAGRVGKILRWKTNLKDVKIYNPQQLSSGNDQYGLSAAQNEEVEIPLSSAVLTAATKQSEETRPPPNRTHEQTRETCLSQASCARMTPTGWCNQASTQQHARTSWINQAFSVYRGKQLGLDPTACPDIPSVQSNLHQPSHLIRREPYIHRPPHPIRKKHSASPYRPPHLNRAEQKNQNSLNFRRLLRVVFSPLSNIWIDRPLMPSSKFTTWKPGSDLDWLIIQTFA